MSFASREDELKHIIDQWAVHNNLRLNQKKTAVFHAADQPASFSNIKRVSRINILGVSINNQLSMS